MGGRGECLVMCFCPIYRQASFSAPETLPVFNMHLCIPILDCTLGTVGQGGGLCHAVLGAIGEVSGVGLTEVGSHVGVAN